MSDVDVTDHYELEWTDDVTAHLTLKSGTRIAIELGGLPDSRVSSCWRVSMPDGELIADLLQIWEDDATARSRMQYLVRTIINAEEPLGSPVNWSNHDLVSLLVEQERVMLCPHCLGSLASPCGVCQGNNFVTSDEFSNYFNRSTHYFAAPPISGTL